MKCVAFILSVEHAIRSYIPSYTFVKLKKLHGWKGAQILRNLVFLKRERNSQSKPGVCNTWDLAYKERHRGGDALVS